MTLKQIVKRYGIITASCVIYAIGFCWSCMPNNLIVGGFTGIAQILNAFFPVLPVGITTFVLNLPLFIIGIRKLGWQTLAGSLYTIAVSSVMIDGINRFFSFPPTDPFLAGLYGGILSGIAFGFMMRQGATTGGTELVAQLLKLRISSVSIGKIALVIDLAVITVYTITFRQFTLALYSVVMLYMCTTVMDKVICGTTGEKMAFIISEQHEFIARQLLEMDRGVTLLPGTGAYTKRDTNVILCAFNRRFIAPMKKMVKSIDPNAFVIVCDVHEILGKGFPSDTPNS